MADVIETVPRQLLIGGQWVDATGGATFEVTNPATGDSRVTVTSDTGTYQLAALPLGATAFVLAQQLQPKDQ